MAISFCKTGEGDGMVVDYSRDTSNPHIRQAMPSSRFIWGGGMWAIYFTNPTHPVWWKGEGEYIPFIPPRIGVNGFAAKFTPLYA